MKPTAEILASISQNSSSHPKEVFTKLYRYMLRPDIYFLAYKHLYANNGAATPGVDKDDTADGFSEAKVARIIESLKDGSYQPRPVRRTYIDKGNGGGKLVPIWRKSLTRLSPLEIVDTYNAELRGICNYYCMASNYASLNYFSYLMEYSCLKTLSAKARRSLRKTLAAYKDGHGKWGIPYETKTGKKRMYFANWQKCRKEASACNDTINDVFMMHNHNRNSLEARLKARVCELCGTTQGELFELHHVRKVKDLNGKERWEQCMIAKRRKTLVVCKPCHNAIHHGSKSQ